MTKKEEKTWRLISIDKIQFYQNSKKSKHVSGKWVQNND